MAASPPPTVHRVAMICDFFYPSMGGVENHIYQTAQCLLRLGHKVVVVTHRYGSRCGVRWLANGLKVYHLPFAEVYDRCVLPSGVLLLPVLRDVLLREQVSVVHTHAISTMSLEAVVLASLLGYRVVHTEHSNFGFASAIDINLNQLEGFVLSQADTVIAVSHTSKENVALRCALVPENVYVIPNAVDTTQFTPDPDNVRPKGTINVVVMTRLVWRKGAHLLVRLIPLACARFPYVHFIIGGDGPKRLALDEMVERHQLHERVELLGAVAHSDVPSVLTRAHVFLNTSLTEAFCIAILEAVSCGLLVVSTKVGGVPEILPKHMLLFAQADGHSAAAQADALLEALSEALSTVRKRRQPTGFHRDVCKMYSWADVARRTCVVYDAVGRRPRPSLVRRLRLLAPLGPIAGPVAAFVFTAQFLLLAALRWWRPDAAVEAAPDWPRDPIDGEAGGGARHETRLAGTKLLAHGQFLDALASRREGRKVVIGGGL